MRSHSSRPSRWLVPAAGLFGASLVALGIAWAAGRLQSREAPRWDERAYVSLRVDPGAPPAWDERWVVALHPGCPHCQISLASLATARNRSAAPVQVAALLVDVELAPAESTVGRLPADETHWDSANRWRRQWAHRVYGEILCFGPDGRLLRLLPPIANERDALARFRAARLATRLD
ncbi:MAG: hypothetical protein ABIS67_00405 [Candidatus Eisenbacteria bacterium]